MTSNQNKKTFDELIAEVYKWAYDRDLLRIDNAHKQMCKVIEEVGETSSALLKGNFDELKDGIGDSFVTLIILAEQIGFDPKECLESAWNEIKDRQGKTINGVFIKEN
jgi:NTP pyrophosphatase (non-canonical NTP hydrolase)